MTDEEAKELVQAKVAADDLAMRLGIAPPMVARTAEEYRAWIKQHLRDAETGQNFLSKMFQTYGLDMGAHRLSVALDAIEQLEAFLLTAKPGDPGNLVRLGEIREMLRITA